MLYEFNGTYKSYAFIEGYNAAKNGNHIDNCYPFTDGQDHWDWIDGFNSFKIYGNVKS